MITRRDSRNRIGIVWFDDEQEAQAFAARMFRMYPPESIEAANMGFAQCGRDRSFDLPGEYAVVTP